MRVTEIVDYNRVQDRHQAIHARLENWRRWVIVRPHGWQVAPMFRMYQSKARQWVSIRARHCWRAMHLMA